MSEIISEGESINMALYTVRFRVPKQDSDPESETGTVLIEEHWCAESMGLVWDRIRRQREDPETEVESITKQVPVLGVLRSKKKS